MTRTRRVRRWALGVAAAAALMAAGGLAHAAIPDAGGVIDSCYAKSSGAWRVIDTGLGQACKSNELLLDLYSKGGADALFLDSSEADALYLGKTAKAADSDKLDGQDSADFLGVNATATNSSKLNGRPAAAYLLTNGGFVLTDAGNHSDGVVSAFGCCVPEDPTPSVTFELTCDVGGGTSLVASSEQSFSWWWDETAGDATLVPAGYEAQFAIGNGVERHTLRATMPSGATTTMLDLDTSIATTCLFGWTLLKSVNASPGGP